MGFFDSIGNLFGGAPNNSGFNAQGVSPEQINGAINSTSGALAQQNALAQALQAQGQQGMGSQLQLGQALQQQAQGLGPNPASAMLANTTGQNIASQSALMAGQRGAGANVGLLARQAGQQGAGIQQQAAGQDAVLQAQQQLAAQGQLQNLASNQIGQQAGAIGNANQFALQNQGQMFGLQGNQNSTNQAMAGVNANNTAHLYGGLMNGLGGALSGFSSGGEVPDHLNHVHQIYHGGHYEHAQSGKLSSVPETDRFQEGGMVPGKPEVNKNDPKNDTVVAKLTPEEIVLPLSVTQAEDPAKEAAKFVTALMAKKGGQKQEEGEFKSALKDAIKSRKKSHAKAQ